MVDLEATTSCNEEDLELRARRDKRNGHNIPRLHREPFLEFFASFGLFENLQALFLDFAAEKSRPRAE